MAWLEQRAGQYHLAFRLGDQKYKKSLKTSDPDTANARLHRVLENIRLVESGRLTIPERADVGRFLLSDGKLNGKPQAPKRLTLGKLFEAYQQSLPKDALEPDTLRIAGVHMRHIVRLLGSRTNLRAITPEQLQKYVNKRSHEPGKRGQSVSAGTIKKELATLRTLWSWATSHGYVSGQFPKDGIKLPKQEEKPPFQTWQQIERQIESGGLTDTEQQGLWDCLFLSTDEMAGILDYVKQASKYPFLYPMCVLAAHTGARRSELCRSREMDFDLQEGTVRIRERKRSKGKRTTRLVPLSPMLHEVIGEWFQQKPKSPFTFPEDHQVQRTRNTQPEEGCVTPDEASHHLQQVLLGSRWQVLRGWHVFRHSFISNCVCKGVDQRMIDSWVGHQTDEMRRRYTHLFPSVQTHAIRQVFPA